MFYRRPIGDRHAWSETNRRPIGDLDMLYWTPIWNQHVSSGTDMPDQRPSYMPNWRYNGDRHAKSKTLQRPTCLIIVLIQIYINKQKIYKINYIFKYICVKIPIGLRRHVGLRWVYTGMSVYDGAYRSPIRHSVSKEACWGLRWVYD